jgi:hypothetical protein
MDQLGHTDPAFTLRVYRHGMRRDAQSKLALSGLVGLSDWAAMGSTDVSSAPPSSDAFRYDSKKVLSSRAFTMGTAGLEPATSRV